MDFKIGDYIVKTETFILNLSNIYKIKPKKINSEVYKIEEVNKEENKIGFFYEGYYQYRNSQNYRAATEGEIKKQKIRNIFKKTNIENRSFI
jgi:hypothetical protein